MMALFFSALLAFAQAAAAPSGISLSLKGAKAEVGDNSLLIDLRNSPVKDSKKVRVLASMPAMGSMPYMEVQGDVVAKGPGLFEAQVELTMGGTWELTVTVGEGAAQDVLHYAVTTGIPGISDKNSTGTKPSGAEMSFGPERLQRIGVTFHTVKRESLRRTLRATGVVESDASRRSEVSLRFSGYVQKTFGRQVGESVRTGDPLALIDSPELLAAQREFLLALQMQGNGHISAPVSEERLRTLGMSAADIAALKKRGSAEETLTVRAPQSGTLLEIAARDGSRVEAGQLLFVVGDLAKTFLYVKVPEKDLRDLKPGMRTEISIPGLSEKPIPGLIDLVAPSLDQGEGEATVRVRPLKPSASMRAGGFAAIQTTALWSPSLTVPNEAILFTGNHSYVFLDKGNGKLEPIEVIRGRQTETQTEIIEGLSEGQRVAASGTFLLSAEANLRSALPRWTNREEQR